MQHPAEHPIPETRFVNEVRLNPRQWAIAIVILLVIFLLTPRLWTRVEHFETGAGYRIPYSLSKDYWLYQRRLAELRDPNQVVLLGDSVIWGEYVLPNATLPHFLNQRSGETNRFINGGVNGLFPLALEGLIRHYATGLKNRKVLLHWNALWMSSPKVDLQTEKEEKFNHASLVPQFRPRIPSYKADSAQRLGIVIGRNVPFLAWVDHLQNTYFEQQDILTWSLSGQGNEPRNYTNTYRNPLAQITLRVPSEPVDDPDRGPASSRHRAWSDAGIRRQRFDWVDPEKSLQWQAFQRLARLLSDRGNKVFVVAGPFNEHLLTQENQAVFRKLKDVVLAWLNENKIPSATPETLPSELYADASHPLSSGYELLAKRLFNDAAFQEWFLH